eukprot:g11752.t1
MKNASNIQTKWVLHTAPSKDTSKTATNPGRFTTVSRNFLFGNDPFTVKGDNHTLVNNFGADEFNLVWAWGAIDDHNGYTATKYNAFDKIAARGSRNAGKVPGDAKQNLCQSKTTCNTGTIPASVGELVGGAAGGETICGQLVSECRDLPATVRTIAAKNAVFGTSKKPPAGKVWMPPLKGLDLRLKDNSLLKQMSSAGGSNYFVGLLPADFSRERAKLPGVSLRALSRRFCGFPLPGVVFDRPAGTTGGTKAAVTALAKTHKPRMGVVDGYFCQSAEHPSNPEKNSTGDYDDAPGSQITSLVRLQVNAPSGPLSASNDTALAEFGTVLRKATARSLDVDEADVFVSNVSISSASTRQLVEMQFEVAEYSSALRGLAGTGTQQSVDANVVVRSTNTASVDDLLAELSDPDFAEEFADFAFEFIATSAPLLSGASITPEALQEMRVQSVGNSATSQESGADALWMFDSATPAGGYSPAVVAQGEGVGNNAAGASGSTVGGSTISGPATGGSPSGSGAGAAGATGTSSGSDDDDNGPAAWVIVVAVIGGLLVCGGIATGIFFIVMQSGKGNKNEVAPAAETQ